MIRIWKTKIIPIYRAFVSIIYMYVKKPSIKSENANPAIIIYSRRFRNVIFARIAEIIIELQINAPNPNGINDANLSICNVELNWHNDRLSIESSFNCIMIGTRIDRMIDVYDDNTLCSNIICKWNDEKYSNRCLNQVWILKWWSDGQEQ